MKAIAVTTRPGGRDLYWLDEGFGMVASSPVRGAGFNLAFGNRFTSPPAATATLAPYRPTLDSGLNEEESATSGDTGPGSEVGPLATEVLRDDETAASSYAGGATSGLLSLRTDIFALGPAYQLLHKRLWGSFDRNDLSAWHDLGGIFTSAPSAVAFGRHVDVFAVGLDHALFTRSCDGDTWSPAWQSLGGAFTSPASIVARKAERLDLFIRGSDFTLRTNHRLDREWFGWQNLGGDLASAPVAISTSPARLDVFAIFRDGALWHRWWDGEIWNEWETLGGAYVDEPAAVAAGGQIDVFAVSAENRGLILHSNRNDSWQQPVRIVLDEPSGLAAAPVAIATAPNHVEIFLPMANRQLRYAKREGGSWSFGSLGARVRVPQRYHISVDYVHVVTTRALNSDTDAGALTIAVGNCVSETRTQWIGSLGGIADSKTSQTNLLEFKGVVVDLAEPMSFSYIIVNNGHGDEDKILMALVEAGDSLNVTGSRSMQEDIARGIVQFVSVKISEALTLPVLGSILGKIETWLFSKVTDFAFESCDGIVAVEMGAMLGRDLHMRTNGGRDTVTVKTTHAGTSSPTICGANSKYEVTWTIKPM